MKKCSKCGDLKLLSEFSPDKRNTDGLHYNCKICRNQSAKEYRTEHPQKVKESIKKWRSNNKEKVNEQSRQWHKNNLERGKELAKIWWIKNKEKEKKRQSQWRKENNDIYRLSIERWRINNLDKVRESRRLRSIRERSTVRGHLNHVISCRIRASLKGFKQGRKWESLVTFTIDNLKIHLERQFQIGMSWENYGEWHIDHKIPVSAFNFEKPEDIDFKKCWSLKNLQPLWAKENISKGNTIDSYFQPSLSINT